MISFDYVHSTPTTSIVITVKAIVVNAELLKTYENKQKFEKLCEIGCPNYNNKWACPPFSPSYTQFSKNYVNALLILQYCNLMQFTYTKTEYIKLKASNSILKSKSDKLMRFLEEEYSGMMLSNGSCRLCKPCSKKSGGLCKKPNKMRYSMEALGLNVEQITEDFFNHKLQWYKNKLVPGYSSVVSCLLSNSQLSINEISPKIITYCKK